MSLAQTLQASIDQKNAAAAAAMAAANTPSVEQQADTIMRHAQLEIWKAMITADINNNRTDIYLALRSKSPHAYLTDYKYRSNLQTLLNTKEGQSFIEWLDNNGLSYVISDAHDGMGIESWQNIRIVVKE